MDIRNSTLEDLENIYFLYDAAIAHQKAVSTQHWLPFDRALVEREIAEGGNGRSWSTGRWLAFS